MNNKEFYAYCRDNRKTAESLAKREALVSVYNFMRECGTTKAGVKQFVEHQVRQSQGRHYDIEAYQWVLSVFDGPSLQSKVPDGQMTLF